MRRLAVLAMVAFVLAGCGSGEATKPDSYHEDPYHKVPEGPDAKNEGFVPHEVLLPAVDGVRLAPPAELPAKATVAVAFVRKGVLARCPDDLLAVAQALESDDAVDSVVALGGFDKSVQHDSIVGLPELARAAALQKAALLLIDCREDPAAPAAFRVFVVHAASGGVLVHVAAKPAQDPARAADLPARLVQVDLARVAGH